MRGGDAERDYGARAGVKNRVDISPPEVLKWACVASNGKPAIPKGTP